MPVDDTNDTDDAHERATAVPDKLITTAQAQAALKQVLDAIPNKVMVPSRGVLEGQFARLLAQVPASDAAPQDRLRGLRIECLHIAGRHAEHRDEVVARAQAYLGWVTAQAP